MTQLHFSPPKNRQHLSNLSYLHRATQFPFAYTVGHAPDHPYSEHPLGWMEHHRAQGHQELAAAVEVCVSYTQSVISHWLKSLQFLCNFFLKMLYLHNSQILHSTFIFLLFFSLEFCNLFFASLILTMSVCLYPCLFVCLQECCLNIAAICDVY